MTTTLELKPGTSRRGRKPTHTELLFRDVARQVAPPPDITVSEWAERYRYLSPESCPEPGKWHNNRVPYAVEIMEAFSDPAVEMVVVKCSAQVAKTSIIENVAGYFMHFDPCPIMVVLPTDEMLRAFSKERFAPMVRDTPVLRPLVRDNKAKDAGNTINSKMFPGGHIAMVSAKSAPQLQSRPIRIVLFDEVDRYDEGDPVGHGMMRTARFWNRKIGLFSTPEDLLGSKIETWYGLGTREEWNLPCPHCGEYQTLPWGEQFDHESYTFACRYCGAQANEYQWKAGEGKWVAGRPLTETNQVRSFSLNALVAPGLHWDEIEVRWLRAQAALLTGDIEPMRNFVTQVEGRAYEEPGETADDVPFDDHCHRYDCDVPAGVRLITAAADVQHDRVEVEIRGWGGGFETWGIRKLIFDGCMDTPEMHRQLDQLLEATFTRADGAQLQIARLLIDAGYNPDAVYAYTRERAPRVYAIRGGSDHAAPLVNKPTKVQRKGIESTLFVLGVNQGKERAYRLLRVKAEGPGYCHWPTEAAMSDGLTARGYDQTYFAQLTAEKRVTRYTGGRPHIAWVPKHPGIRNEAWDIFVYNVAAVIIYGPQALDSETPPPPAPPAGKRWRGCRVVSRGVK